MRSFLFESFNIDKNNIHVIYVPDAISESDHYHNFIEIVYVTSGCIIHKINNQTFTCYRGDLLVLDTDSIHSFEVINGSSYYNICLRNNKQGDSDFYKTLITQNIKETKNKIISFNGEGCREIESIMQNMHYEERCDSEEHVAAYNAYANILAIKIIRRLKKHHDDYDNWDNVIKYIDNNISSQLSLHSVARTCAYNPSYFSRLFKAKTGDTFISYINKRRIEKAKDYLLNSETSIEEITKNLGFSSVQTFYKTFKSIEGIPPIKLKEQYKAK